MSYIFDYNFANPVYADTGQATEAIVGGTVASVPDSLGIGQVISQSELGKRPQLQLYNGHRGLKFDGIDDLIYTPLTLAHSATPTIHTVCYIASLPPFGPANPVGCRFPNNVWAIQWPNSNGANIAGLAWEAVTNSGKGINVGIASAPAGLRVLSLRNNGTNLRLFADGVSIGVLSCAGIQTTDAYFCLGSHRGSAGGEHYGGMVLRSKYDNAPQSDAEVLSEATALLAYYSSPPPSTSGAVRRQRGLYGIRKIQGWTRF